MRFIVAAVGATLCVNPCAGFASAQTTPAVSINPFPGRSGLNTERMTSISGSCGEAAIRVMGIKSMGEDFFDTDADAGEIIVRRPHAPELRVTYENGLSDHNGVACIDTKDYTRVLIWSDCAGSACGHGYIFTVAELDRPRIISPADCDEDCAFRLTGSQLPYNLNPKR